jgi:hypothetical protein
MATLALGILGSAVLGPIGGAVGALAGSIIDQTIIIPGLFPQAPIDGPKVDEFRIQTQDEGSAANFVLGTDFRCAGTIRWVSDIIEETETEEVGGKGGGGAKIRHKVYFAHLAICIAKSPITAVKKIFAEGKLLYDANPDIAYASNLLSCTVTGTSIKKRMLIASPANGPDLSKLQSGKSVVSAGWINGGNNGTFKCVSSSKDQSSGASTCVLKNSGAVAESAGAGVTLSQDLDTFDPAKVAAITFYNGDESQTPDSLIESYEGPGNVPAFRGSAYFVMTKLALGPYGNRIPQFAIIGESAAGLTVGTAIAKIMERSGRAPGEYDVTAIAGDNKGFTVSGPQSTAQQLQPLLLAHDVLEQEGNGALRFFHRRDAKVINVPESDLVAHEAGTDAPRPLEVSDMPDAELPADVTVKFLDLDKDGNAGAQKARKNDIETDGTITVDLNLVMTGGKGIAAARRFLWVAWGNRQPVRLQLPPKYWYAQENDCIRVQALDFPWLLLINRIDYGFNHVIVAECTLELRNVLTQSEEYDPPDVTVNHGNIVPGQAEGFAFEGPPLVPASGGPTDGPQIIFPVAIEDDDQNWGGATIFVSPDDDDYVPLGPVGIESTMGFTLTVLPSGPTHVWDRTSTVDVYLVNGTLENRSEADVLNGANRALIGGEIIGFATATLIAANTYRLSVLLRGFRNTEDQVGTHAVNEDFCWLNVGFGVFNVNPLWVGQTKYFKAVLSGGDIDDVDPISRVITGASLKPFSPTDPHSQRNASNDVTVSWKRRSRAIHDGFSASQPPLMEELERYEVEFWYFGVLKRTYSVEPAGGTISPSVTYPGAQQEADGLPALPATPVVQVKVFQMSVAAGRGKALEFTTV